VRGQRHGSQRIAAEVKEIVVETEVVEACAERQIPLTDAPIPWRRRDSPNRRRAARQDKGRAALPRDFAGEIAHVELNERAAP
jgi:hypothetical protein